MRNRLLQVLATVGVVLVAAQFIRPDRTNPATDVTRAIQAHAGTTSALAAVLERACNDCHSNATVWPWYMRIAPLSWLWAYGVKEGRKVLNFSDWAAYPLDQRQKLLAASCRDASTGKMPGTPYTLLHPEARLSVEDIQAICAASREAEAPTARVSQ